MNKPVAYTTASGACSSRTNIVPDDDRALAHRPHDLVERPALGLGLERTVARLNALPQVEQETRRMRTDAAESADGHPKRLPRE